IADNSTIATPAPAAISKGVCCALIILPPRMTIAVQPSANQPSLRDANQMPSEIAMKQRVITLLAFFIEHESHRHALHFDELIAIEPVNLLRLNFRARQEDRLRQNLRSCDHANRRNQRCDQDLATRVRAVARLTSVPGGQEATSDDAGLRQIVVEKERDQAVEEPGPTGGAVQKQQELIVQIRKPVNG